MKTQINMQRACEISDSNLEVRIRRQPYKEIKYYLQTEIFGLKCLSAVENDYLITSNKLHFRFPPDYFV